MKSLSLQKDWYILRLGYLGQKGTPINSHGVGCYTPQKVQIEKKYRFEKNHGLKSI